jgi:hypothetical protein
MREFAVGVLVGLVVLITMVPNGFAGTKVNLIPCPKNYLPGSTPPPGGGFVTFNNPYRLNVTLDVTVSLNGVEPETSYDIYVFVDHLWLGGAKAGTIETNPEGNGSFRLNALVPKGRHTLALGVTKSGSRRDVYDTPGLEEGQGTVMVFR